MLALFDANVYIGELTGRIPAGESEKWRSQYLIRLSPVVYHELLRGARKKDLIYEIRDRTVSTPVPTFKMWEESATILSQWVFSSGRNEVLFKLQNDILIALTARSLGAVVITQDRHFEKIAERVSFLYFLHGEKHDPTLRHHSS